MILLLKQPDLLLVPWSFISLKTCKDCIAFQNKLHLRGLQKGIFLLDENAGVQY